MAKLRHFFRLSALHDDLETKLLVQEYRSLLSEDRIDDRSEELRERLFAVSDELSSLGHRHRHR